MVSITTQTIGRRDFLRAAGLGLAGLGTATTTIKADGDGRPVLTERQRQLQSQREQLNREMNEVRDEIARLRRLGESEANLERKAKAYSWEFAQRTVDLENAEMGSNRRRAEIGLPHPLTMGLAGGATFLLASVLIKTLRGDYDKSPNNQVKLDTQESIGEYQI